jgi:hypothetical protein
MVAQMKSQLFVDLIRFSASKKNKFERCKYIFFGLIFYLFLLKDFSVEKHIKSETASQAGDDIYPLF